MLPEIDWYKSKNCNDRTLSYMAEVLMQNCGSWVLFYYVHMLAHSALVEKVQVRLYNICWWDHCEVTPKITIHCTSCMSKYSRKTALNFYWELYQEHFKRLEIPLLGIHLGNSFIQNTYGAGRLAWHDGVLLWLGVIVIIVDYWDRIYIDYEYE